MIRRANTVGPLQCKDYGPTKQSDPAALQQILYGFYKNYVSWYQIKAYYLYIINTGVTFLNYQRKAKMTQSTPTNKFRKSSRLR